MARLPCAEGPGAKMRHWAPVDPPFLPSLCKVYSIPMLGYYIATGLLCGGLIKNKLI